MEPTILGIDVAKNDFHASLLFEDGKSASRSFPNNRSGFEQLGKWLRNRKIERVHACLEATGGWSEALALDLHERGHVVSIVNPHRIKAFGQSEGLRTKTDAVDAALIARFCRAHHPPAWEPPEPAVRALQALVRRRQSLVEMRTQELNRAQVPQVDSLVARSVDEHIAYLDRQIEIIDEQIDHMIDDDPRLREQRELLETIPGIARRTATTILGEIPSLAEFRDVKAVAAQAGLSPRHRQSGIDPGRSRLSKTGNARLRQALYFPAMVAMKVNPLIRTFAARLHSRGKPPMVVIAAAMRKLLTIAYGVLKAGLPFSPGRLVLDKA
jgi:transposase